MCRILYKDSSEYCKNCFNLLVYTSLWPIDGVKKCRCLCDMIPNKSNCPKYDNK